MMKNRPIVLLFVFIFLFCLNTAAQIKPVEEVLKLVNEYDQAWGEKDPDTVSRILSPDYVYFTATGKTSDFQQTIDSLKSPKYNLTYSKRSEIKTFCTGKTIVVSSRWIGKGTYDEQVFDDDQRCGLVFVNDGGQWKLAAEHCVNIVAK